MNLSALFIKRPVATTLVMLGILFFGLMAYTRLPVSDLPNVDFPTISVSANLPGASPETMAASVATQLEKEFSTIAGLSSMNSTSVQGSSQITLQFELSRNLDAAAQDVQAAIAHVARRLPADMPAPPVYQKVNPADAPILFIALTSPTLPPYEIDRYGQTIIAQRISTVSGVAQVQVYGAQKYAVRIQLDPKELQNRGLGIDEVTRAITGANANLPTGMLYGANKAFTVEARGQLERAADYEQVIVSYRNGSPVRLGELGQAIDSVENNKVAAWLVDQRAMMLAIYRQPGTNTVQVADAVRALLPSFKTQLPAAISLQLIYDRSDSIRASVDDVQLTLLVTLCLVVLVIFLFLRSLSSTLIPSLALPLAVVGTFAVMYLLGYSLDNLSLMALTLSVGFVVDDAIVVLENIHRHMELGKPRRQAALDGAAEVGFTVVSMTLSLVAVFIPVLFMGGIIGRLFEEFAVTIAAAVLISGVVSLTLTPMLASRFLRQQHTEQHGAAFRASERVFAGVTAGYSAALRWSLRHRLFIVAVTLAVMAGSVVLFMVVPKGFIPTEDSGQLNGQTEAVEGISFDAMVEKQKAVAAIVAQDPNIERFMSSVGRGGAAASNSGFMFIRLKPRGERRLSSDQVIAELRPKLSQIPGMRVYLTNPPPIRFGGRMSKSQYQVTLQGPDTDELYRYAPALEARLRELPGLRDISTDLLLKNPQVQLRIDREQAAALGISVAQIQDALFSAYGSRQVSTIYASDDTYKVILELLPQYQADPSALSLLYVRAQSGELVPLETLGRLEQSVGPYAVSHSGQLPAVTLSFDLTPGTALGDAVAQVERAALETLPPTISTSFQGTAQVFKSSLQGMGLLLLLAVLVIYLVLGILYESFWHPITILSALPFAGFGALLTLWVFGVELSIYAYVGVVMLVGLVKKNGIMMVDFAVEEQRRGKNRIDAIHDASVVRFRPIMMTTMAALFGTLPIALGLGAGAEARQPLGLAVVGGLLFSQTLTLFVTPVIFTYFDQLQSWLGRKRA